MTSERFRIFRNVFTSKNASSLLTRRSKYYGSAAGAAAISIREMKLIEWLAFAGLTIPAAGQSTSGEFRPETDIFVQQGDRFRIEFDNYATDTLSTHSWVGNFAYYIETALNPVLRRNLREHPNVYRDRYLTMRGGYLHQTSLSNGQSTSGDIGILELKPRYRLPLDLVISDRNRGEFRFFKEKPFYTRYRNQLQLERDIKRGRFVCTPFVYDEVFYDSLYGQWIRNRYAFGVQFVAGKHMVFDPYYMRQNGSHSNPSHVNVFGFKWDLYF